jgi:hypothetical protein
MTPNIMSDTNCHVIPWLFFGSDQKGEHRAMVEIVTV